MRFSCITLSFHFSKSFLTYNHTTFHRRSSRVWSRFVSLPRNATNPSVAIEVQEETKDLEAKVNILKQKMEVLGISCHDTYAPGHYHLLYCPKCKGGRCVERTLSVHIIQDGGFAMWRCFLAECGWAGQAFADNNGIDKFRRVKTFGQATEESLGFEPLSSELIAYFAERKISEGTLKRNAVMQLSGDQAVIAFTYRRNGLLVGCKYRTLEKRFWLKKGTEKALYGLDDIKEATEIIIVEGEIDKLSLEEAGFSNCVSVPTGAPQKISAKELPSPDKDTAFQYVWNCKDYFDKVSRIILATDGDAPGQALAEELARRLGKERCWRVRWQGKNEATSFKDANEVLQLRGPAALREAMGNAEPL